MAYKNEISKNIALCIKSSGKSQVQIADEMEITRNAITEYVSGRSLPTIWNLKKLCKILDCSFEDILGRVE